MKKNISHGSRKNFLSFFFGKIPKFKISRAGPTPFLSVPGHVIPHNSEFNTFPVTDRYLFL